jgi:hypothetical protein
MFVRFRQTPRRLQVSLVETRRVDGKVRHEHIAALGSIETPPSVEERIAFWQRLHERLAKLSNRLDGTTQGKILGDVHAHIPMVTVNEQQASKVANAETHQQFWSSLHDMSQGQVEGQKALAASVERAIASGQVAAAEAAAKAATMRDRVGRLKRGEDVPGFDKPLTREDMERALLEAGATKADIRHMGLLATLSVSEIKNELVPELLKAKNRVEKRITRAFVKRRSAVRDYVI